MHTTKKTIINNEGKNYSARKGGRTTVVDCLRFYKNL